MTIPISDAESLVMEVLWSRSPRSAEEVVAELAGTRQWAEANIKALPKPPPNHTGPPSP